MSAEESDKPYRITPRMRAGIERLAKITVERNLDPAKVLAALMAVLNFSQKMTPAERKAAIAELKRIRQNLVPRVKEGENGRDTNADLRKPRTPRRYRNQPG